ncbi:MAG: hybrid sensor histidine kinase/response regulator, partial [Longimicrobiales bacterium]
ADGTYRWVHEQLAMDAGADDGAPTLVGSWMDVTASKQQAQELEIAEQSGRELQLRRAERLASIGTLVGGVAHELNNPLTAIASFIELMLAEPRNKDDSEALETMRREAARVAKIVSDLRVLARESQDVRPRDRQPVDLNDILRHVMKVRRYALETGNVKVHMDLAASLPAALGVPSELEQVVLNLVVNASQALEASQRPNKKLTVRSGATRTGVAFEVIDNGTGIPERDVERIFDPFFTSKSPGEGTGLGLSLVHSIVSEHAGRISVNSIEGRGTTFSVWLPLASTAETEARPESGHDAPTLRTLHILVVDDEPAIRLALVRHLRRRGHVVDAVGDGAEALARITTTPFDVIVSDIRMPGMSGDRLLRHLLEDDASDAVRRLLFMTGDPASEATHRALGGHEVPVVPKPFTLADITRAIEERSAGGHAGDRPTRKG